MNVGCFQPLNYHWDEPQCNYAAMYFSLTLPEDTTCPCWHHLMDYISTSAGYGNYALDGTTGDLPLSVTSGDGTTVSGYIPYSQGNEWQLGGDLVGDLAEFYVYLNRTFNVSTDASKFRRAVSGPPAGGYAAGLGNANTQLAACTSTTGSPPEVCLCGDKNNFPIQEGIAGTSPIYSFTVYGDNLATALSDPRELRFVTNCENGVGLQTTDKPSKLPGRHSLCRRQGPAPLVRV